MAYYITPKIKESIKDWLRRGMRMLWMA